MTWTIDAGSAAIPTTTTTSPKTLSLAGYGVAADDLVILLATSRDGDPATASFSDPAGWTALGPTLNHGPTGGSAYPGVAHRSWSRVIDGTESDPSVTRSGSGGLSWGLSGIVLRSDHGESPTITNVWDDTTGSASGQFYQPPSVSASRCSLFVQWAYGRADTAGNAAFPGTDGSDEGWLGVGQSEPTETNPLGQWRFGTPNGILTAITTRGTVTSPNYRLVGTGGSALSRTISVLAPGGCGNHGWKVGTL